MKIPHGIFSLFSLTRRCRISSLESRSRSSRHSAGQGGSGGRKRHLSASAPPLNWQSSSSECSCNASHHHSTCPGQLQCKRSFISEVWVGHSSGLYCSPGSQQHRVMGCWLKNTLTTAVISEQTNINLPILNHYRWPSRLSSFSHWLP